MSVAPYARMPTPAEIYAQAHPVDGAQNNGCKQAALEINPASILNRIDQDIGVFLTRILDHFQPGIQFPLSALVHELYLTVNDQEEFADDFDEATQKAYLIDVTLAALNKPECQHLQATTRNAVAKQVEKELNGCCCIVA